MATPPNAVAMAAAPPVELELGTATPSSPPVVVAAGPPVVLLKTVVLPGSLEVLGAEVLSIAVFWSEVTVGAAVESVLLEPLAVLPVAVAEPDTVAK